MLEDQFPAPRVLNARRHHGELRGETPARALLFRLCSTPEGITANYGARVGSQVVHLAVLNARRHHGELRRASAATSASSLILCSTPEGITANYGGRPPTWCPVSTGAQRPKASRRTTVGAALVGRARRPGAQRPKASRRTTACAWTSGRQACSSAQRPKASRRTTASPAASDARAAVCSTPEGITANYGPGGSGYLQSLAVCSTPEGITANYGSLRGLTGVPRLRSAQRPKASRRTTAPTQDAGSPDAQAVLNARRHHGELRAQDRNELVGLHVVLNARRHHGELRGHRRPVAA